MKRSILQHPDARLREVCQPVNGALLDGLIEDMFETMYSAPGRGLAAPQIGVMLRVFVTDTTWKDGDMSPEAFVNPEIENQSSEVQINEEACLSIVDQSRRVARPAWVDLAWTGLNGTRMQQRFDGFAAACVCHELDHLDGRLILDHPVPS
ncbi:peptide deformylase [Litoreibacter roseus]|uniref:Peptide deformylase n=1 Tax=Litoreibacter roseus TaxID=2601869 RepID=A0A6N6JM83_9RHOB|nr:peptide deformylase [Litoreibacter roseus]GFE66388.1 peptide deformylase [Litoreibacter roseus]